MKKIIRMARFSCALYLDFLKRIKTKAHRKYINLKQLNNLVFNFFFHKKKTNKHSLESESKKFNLKKTR